MRNQTPFMFLGRRGKLFAEVKIHDLTSGNKRTVNHRDECNNELEVSAYDECVSQYKVVIKNNILAEPVE